MEPRLCLAAAWAAWTIKPTLNDNDGGPGLFRALFLCCRVNYRFLFFALFFEKIAFQFSLWAVVTGFWPSPRL